MLSGAVLKQFRTYLKSQVGHGWSVEGRKSKGRLLTRVSFRYLTGERSVVLLTSGNLATSQATINLINEAIDNPNPTLDFESALPLLIL